MLHLAIDLSSVHAVVIKGAPPIAADPGFSDFSENVDFGNSPMGFRVWGGLQSTGNGCGLQIDRFSAQTEPYGSIFDDFYAFDNFGIVFGGLALLPEGPRILRECPEVPGPCENVSCPTGRDLSGLVGTRPDLSELAATSRNSFGLKGPTLGPYT